MTKYQVLKYEDQSYIETYCRDPTNRNCSSKSGSKFLLFDPTFHKRQTYSNSVCNCQTDFHLIG